MAKKKKAPGVLDMMWIFARGRATKKASLS